MSSAEEVELWMKGVNYFEDGRFKDAIFDFQRVSVTAKIVYNIGLCYYRLNEKSKAVKKFSDCVEIDSHFAMGYTMLAQLKYEGGRLNESIDLYNTAFKKLRGNRQVDYKPLGLNYQLQASEILINQAIVSHSKRDLPHRDACLIKARNFAFDTRRKEIEELAKQIQNGLSAKLYKVPDSSVFQPDPQTVKHYRKKNYLGEAKVITTANKKEVYACFSGIKLDSPHLVQKEKPPRPKQPPLSQNDKGSRVINQVVHQKPAKPVVPERPFLDHDYVEPDLNIPKTDFTHKQLEGKKFPKNVSKSMHKPMMNLKGNVENKNHLSRAHTTHNPASGKTQKQIVSSGDQHNLPRTKICTDELNSAQRHPQSKRFDVNNNIEGPVRKWKLPQPGPEDIDRLNNQSKEQNASKPFTKHPIRGIESNSLTQIRNCHAPVPEWKPTLRQAFSVDSQLNPPLTKSPTPKKMPVKHKVEKNENRLNLKNTQKPQRPPPPKSLSDNSNAVLNISHSKAEIKCIQNPERHMPKQYPKPTSKKGVETSINNEIVTIDLRPTPKKRSVNARAMTYGEYLKLKPFKIPPRPTKPLPISPPLKKHRNRVT